MGRARRFPARGWASPGPCGLLSPGGSPRARAARRRLRAAAVRAHAHGPPRPREPVVRDHAQRSSRARAPPSPCARLSGRPRTRARARTSTCPGAAAAARGAARARARTSTRAWTPVGIRADRPSSGGSRSPPPRTGIPGGPLPVTSPSPSACWRRARPPRHPAPPTSRTPHRPHTVRRAHARVPLIADSRARTAREAGAAPPERESGEPAHAHHTSTPHARPAGRTSTSTLLPAVADAPRTQPDGPTRAWPVTASRPLTRANRRPGHRQAVIRHPALSSPRPCQAAAPGSAPARSRPVPSPHPRGRHRLTRTRRPPGRPPRGPGRSGRRSGRSCRWRGTRRRGGGRRCRRGCRRGC